MTYRIAPFALLIALFVGGCSALDADGGSEAAEKQAAFEQRVEATVRAILRDPDSAKFSEVKAYPDAGVACGKVNAKNAFGGFVGDDNFAYADGRAALASSNPDTWGVYSNACGVAMKGDALHRLQDAKRTLATSGAPLDERKEQEDDIDRQIAALKNGA